MLPNNLVEVRKNHKFNLSSLNKWVDNHLENYENIIDVKQFVGGQSNPTFVLFFENKEKLEICWNKAGSKLQWMPR